MRRPGPAQQRAHVHERKQAITAPQWTGDLAHDRLGVAIRHRPSGDALGHAPAVDLHRGHVRVVDLSRDGTGGVAADTGEAREIVGPAVFGDHSRRFPEPPRPARVAEPSPSGDHRARAGRGHRPRSREAREEAFPRRRDARHLRLVEHDLRHEHGPAVAGVTPRQVVPPVAGVPSRDLSHGYGGNFPIVSVTPEPFGTCCPAGGFWASTLSLSCGLLPWWEAKTWNPAPWSVWVA
jgi:hypothetical protein